MPGEPTERFILELSACIHLLSPSEEKRGEELEVKSVAVDLVDHVSIMKPMNCEIWTASKLPNVPRCWRMVLPEHSASTACAPHSLPSAALPSVIPEPYIFVVNQ